MRDFTRKKIRLGKGYSVGRSREGTGAGLLGNAGGSASASGGLAGIAASDPSGGALIQAVLQLGLKLESRGAPVETFIIDHIEKTPTEN